MFKLLVFVLVLAVAVVMAGRYCENDNQCQRDFICGFGRECVRKNPAQKACVTDRDCPRFKKCKYVQAGPGGGRYKLCRL
ncbi:hypothetical protein AAVH_23727 [Aphelenchoides avenae]|nr:hypothetical protein AAVH_23727 [Aphelenchus avenae]